MKRWVWLGLACGCYMPASGQDRPRPGGLEPPPGMERMGEHGAGTSPVPTRPAAEIVPQQPAPLAPLATSATPPEPRPATRTGPPGSALGKQAVRMLVPVVALAGAASALTLVLRPSKRSRRARRGRPAPPPLRTAGPSGTPPLPPPIPPALPVLDLTLRRDALLTPAELAFFRALEPLVTPSYAVFSKVRLADLFDVRAGRGRQAAFNQISAKHVDFVLCDPATSKVLAAIELDDRSHQRPDRAERDRFVNNLFAANHLPLIRVPVARSYPREQLRAALLGGGVGIA